MDLDMRRIKCNGALWLWILWKIGEIKGKRQEEKGSVKEAKRGKLVIGTMEESVEILEIHVVWIFNLWEEGKKAKIRMEESPKRSEVNGRQPINIILINKCNHLPLAHSF